MNDAPNNSAGPSKKAAQSPQGNAILFTLPIAILSLAIFINQIYRVSAYDLSRWKGGGMGMFSSIHHERTRFISAFIDINNTEYNLPLNNLDHPLIYNLKAEPTEQNAQQLKSWLMAKRYAINSVGNIIILSNEPSYPQEQISNVSLEVHSIDFEDAQHGIQLSSIKMLSLQ